MISGTECINVYIIYVSSIDTIIVVYNRIIIFIIICCKQLRVVAKQQCTLKFILVELIDSILIISSFTKSYPKRIFTRIFPKNSYRFYIVPNTLIPNVTKKLGIVSTKNINFKYQNL
ncbi:hypothetical protein K501DRAFT_275757 [Backusella circina FSU 941]|nr:hypothetical protein K501DRAFT_275757 [Backusella circina FSU 941]